MFELLEYLTLGLIPGFILLDFVLRARKYETARWWRLRATLVTVGIFFFTGEVAYLWGNLFGDFHLFEGSRLGTVGGAIFGVLVYELCHYWYHRKAHEWNWLWRAGHQMHHSAESLDAFGAYYLHPVDAAIFTSIAALVFFPLLGLGMEAAILATLFLTFNAMFQHANIRTPHWLGYIIQRPESHHVHHSIHRQNYSDLPVWDMLFGTFVNPRTEEIADTRCGFYTGASARLWEMLLGRKVDTPRNATPFVLTHEEVLNELSSNQAS